MPVSMVHRHPISVVRTLRISGWSHVRLDATVAARPSVPHMYAHFNLQHVLCAGETLACPFYLRNSGNVGLQTVSVTAPAAAGCAAGPLEPLARTVACNISVPATQQDFEQGFMRLAMDGSALPRTKSQVPFTWSQSVLVPLTRVSRVSVTGAADPAVVAAPGEP
jgi:hypothetical protein